MDTTKQNEITKLVNQYTTDLLKYASYKVSNFEDAKDLVQDTFEAAIINYEKFENRSNPKTWLFGILNNKIKDYYYRKSRTEFIVTDNYEDVENIYDNFFDDNGNWLENKRPLIWQLDSSEELLDNIDFLRIFQECIGALPSKWCDCIKMKFFENLTGADVCQILGITLSNFWQIIHRSKLKLRECLEYNWFKK